MDFFNKLDNIDVNSAYIGTTLGQSLFYYVLGLQPKNIIEFGTFAGYTTIHMASALEVLGEGHITSYDLWDNYKYKHVTKTEARRNIEKYNLQNYVTLVEKDYNKVVAEKPEFDLLYVDVSNNGKIILDIVSAFKERKGSKIVFEGGSIIRDNVDWMSKYSKIPINNIKSLVNYKVINTSFPSLSIVEL